MGNVPYCQEEQQIHRQQQFTYSEEQRQQVQEILDDFPEVQKNTLFRGFTARYSDLSVINEDRNRYIFLLRIEGEETKVVIPVINQVAHRALVDNYKLVIGRQMIIDPFDERMEAVLIPVRNESNENAAYSMRIVPFRGYNSPAFKRVLEEIWIYKKLQANRNKYDEDPSSLFLWLVDCFIYGVDADQQAIALLYQRVQGSLTLAADYRCKGRQRWKVSERLKILRDVLKANSMLEELGIVHRDIRASNLFYSEQKRRYVLGGLFSARAIKKKDDDDLMTVIGIETQNQGKLKQLISSKQNMGIYNVSDTIYSELRVLNRLLDTRRIADQLGTTDYKQSVFINIENALLNRIPLQDILRTVEGGLRVSDRDGQLQEESGIASKIFKLLPFRHRDLCERYHFNAYCRLGYQIEFSQMAHKMIEKNNLDGHPYANARILKELGLFYERNGSGGTEYLLNSCVLYCKQAESEMERGLYVDAMLNLQLGEETYIHMSIAGEFAMTMIELKRIRTELRARTLWQLAPSLQDQEKTDIFNLMSKTLELAAEQNLPIEKQMKIFLTWGVVHRQCGDKVAAEERFRNGLAVCQNQGSFESHQTAALLKSHFLYELAEMKLEDMQDAHDPLLPMDQQKYDPPQLPKLLENWIQQSLQAREEGKSRPFQSIQCFILLGKLYMIESQYLQSKVQLKRALVRLLDLQKNDKVPYETIVEVHYDLGSVSYKLQDYQQSVDHYRQAIIMLQENKGDPYWTNVIAGNMGLAYLRAGLSERGQSLLDKAKEEILAHNGPNHYDYLFLTSQQKVIKNNVPI